MNKRYDLDAESAYSQSTGTLGGKAYSRSLLDFADASYETLTWVTGSLRHKHFKSPIDVEVAAGRVKQNDHCSHAGHVWHRRKTLRKLLHVGISSKCNECQRRCLSKSLWTCLVETCQSSVCDQCKKMRKEDGGVPKLE